MHQYIVSCHLKPKEGVLSADEIRNHGGLIKILTHRDYYASKFDRLVRFTKSDSAKAEIPLKAKILRLNANENDRNQRCVDDNRYGLRIDAIRGTRLPTHGM